MSRVFVDEDFLSWEAYASGGKFGLPDQPKIVFNCLSEPRLRARFVVHDGDNAGAAQTVHELPEERLREMLKGARELD